MLNTNELFTLRDFLRWTTTQFNQAKLCFGHGTDNAWDEAVALMLHTLYLPHNITRDILDARLTQEEKEKFLALVDQRIKKRMPLAYLTQEAWFAGLSFYVDPRVLIPRSSIAELIQQRFEPWIGSETVSHILDLCTGSGCIAIASAKMFPEAIIDASDISADALQVAEINIKRHEVADQINLIHSDLFKNIPPKKYNIIVSNPPYVDQSDMQSLPPEYLHEPQLGLAAGKDGLDVIKQILSQAANWLTPEGILVIESGNSEIALMEQFPHLPFNWLEFECGDGGVFLLYKKDLESI